MPEEDKTIIDIICKEMLNCFEGHDAQCILAALMKIHICMIAHVSKNALHDDVLPSEVIETISSVFKRTLMEKFKYEGLM